jgi:predicted MPP superfamily phosphohydrolase
MKLFLKVLAWIYLAVGLLALSLPFAVLSSALTGQWNALSIIMMLPALFLAIGLIWLSVTYLREKRKNVAESMATLTGILVWLSINTATIDFAEPVEEKFGTFAIFGVIFLPIFVGMMATKLMRMFIRKAYEQSSDQGGVINSESLRSST